MRMVSLMFASLLAGLLACTNASAADDAALSGVRFDGGDGSYQRAVEKGITFVIAADPPSTFQDNKTNSFDGADVRIFREVAKRLGITKVSWNIVPFDAMIPTLLSGRADVIVDNLHETEARLRAVAFTSPAYWYGSGIAVQRGNPAKIHDWADFAGHTVGTLRGTINHQLLSERKDLKELKLYTSNEAEFSDLIAGRIDVAMEDDIKISQFLKQHPTAAMEMVTDYKPLPQEYGYARYALRKGDVDLNNAVSRALDEIRADGTLGAIIAQFGYTDRNLWYFPVKN
ncbi:substrate-binding periplasmic protein [Paraburkholderia phenazinium]|uniref:Amino acid ABC transporter substrate-binding protein, PAAT family n=1 Tax=Paraburkholderia phenazinium TaxID=60549 RepID=A0A1G8IDZ9_9BURK|nr:ABC transporter substrate-binding protein [Paraburkholderia phenazinium]SDI17027.1 amino acid ABC transporter substrate-binding protein, PAAT family [Paraburkholderia phenazinium]